MLCGLARSRILMSLPSVLERCAESGRKPSYSRGHPKKPADLAALTSWDCQVGALNGASAEANDDRKVVTAAPCQQTEARLVAVRARVRDYPGVRIVRARTSRRDR